MSHAADRLPISYRQFDHWCTRGWIRGGRPGTGNPRHLDDKEMRVLAHMAALVSDGVRPDRAAVAARELVETGQTALGGHIIKEES
jgi:hypothetical protein